MKIGYPCINRTLPCKASGTFKLASYSEERLIETLGDNLSCLLEILKFNVAHHIFFFRISSDLVPFASHPVCKFNWATHFKGKFKKIGKYINEKSVRISMHPDQFVLINAIDEKILERSVQELIYHAKVLDLLDLDNSHKMQIHLGGVYNDKAKSMRRFIERYEQLDYNIKRRLVLENDERNYSLRDCMGVYDVCGIPILFDTLHHQLNNHGEDIESALDMQADTWSKEDGLPMVDYSHQQPNAKLGSHAYAIDPSKFKDFLQESTPHDFDVMLEIKDKEKSALKAIDIAKGDPRFV